MIHEILGLLYELQNDYEKAFEEYTRSERGGDLLTPHQEKKLREAFSSSGWRGYLLAHAEHLTRQAETRYVPSSAIARDYASLGDNDKAFEWLERAYLERDLSLIDLSLIDISVDLKYVNLRSDSRFISLLQKMGLEKYQ
jgi:tetratricopeptide (TPR) repeat protein